jgi:FMN reductase
MSEAPPAGEAPVRIVGVSGSLRPGSVTLLALAEALRGARAGGAKAELLDLRALPLPMRDENPAEDEAPHVIRLRATIKAADGVILGTPEYHGSFSGALKNALDLLSDAELGGKMVGLVAVAGGPGHGATLSQLRAVMRALHAWVVPHDVVVPFATDAFGEDRRIKDARLAARLAEVGAEVARFARLHRGARTA